MLLDMITLQRKAAWLRSSVLEMVARAGKGHIGGAFSMAEILVALYGIPVLRFNPADPRWDARDRFLLSKGHSCEALYVLLADLGFFSNDEISVTRKAACWPAIRTAGCPGLRRIPGLWGMAWELPAAWPGGRKWTARIS